MAKKTISKLVNKAKALKTMEDGNPINFLGKPLPMGTEVVITSEEFKSQETKNCIQRKYIEVVSSELKEDNTKDDSPSDAKVD